MSDSADLPLRVVKGDPTPEELAALVAVVSAKVAEAGVDDPGQPSTWASYWRRVRTPLRPGRGAWRASALPR
jgi:Acyl-CoA carboxylase epsilon subunit